MADILGINPVAGVTTTFKVRFDTECVIPAHCHVQLFFPNEYLVKTDGITAKRNIECEFEITSLSPVDSYTCLTLGVPTEEIEVTKKTKAPKKKETEGVRTLFLSESSLFNKTIVFIVA